MTTDPDADGIAARLNAEMLSLAAPPAPGPASYLAAGRRRLRRRRLAAAGAGLALAAALTGAVALPRWTTDRGGTDQPAATASSPPPRTAPALRADLTIQEEGVGLLAVVNTSADTVRLSGWPALTFEAADRSVVRVPVTHVRQPGPSTSFALPPGTTAFAGVQWVTGDKSAPASYTVTALRVSVPGIAGDVYAHLIAIDGTSTVQSLTLRLVRVGTLQPSPQGVNAW
jgi:hypothetical protein